MDFIQFLKFILSFLKDLLSKYFSIRPEIKKIVEYIETDGKIYWVSEYSKIIRLEGLNLPVYMRNYDDLQIDNFNGDFQKLSTVERIYLWDKIRYYQRQWKNISRANSKVW